MDPHYWFTGERKKKRSIEPTPEMRATNSIFKAVFGSAIGGIALVVIFLIFAFNRVSRESGFTPGQLFAGIVVIVAVVVLGIAVVRGAPERKLNAAVAKMPRFGPIDLQTQIYFDGSMHRLRTTINMAREDFETIQQMKIAETTLFTLKAYTQEHRLSNREQYGTDDTPITLLNVLTAPEEGWPFSDAVTANAAKDTLIEALQQMRARIEAYLEARDSGHYDRVEI